VGFEQFCGSRRGNSLAKKKIIIPNECNDNKINLKFRI